jgi:hypothetical protein
MAAYFDDLPPCDGGRHEECQLSQCSCLCHQVTQTLIQRLEIVQDNAHVICASILAELRRRNA